MIDHSLIKENFTDYRIGNIDGKTYCAVALAYQTKGVESKKGYGILSRYSWGKDYHIVLKDRILKVFGDEAKYFYISNDINVREVAVKLGLGSIGKNNLLINEKSGSFFLLAIVELNHNIQVEEQVTNFDPCVNCDICEKACPGNALKDYTFDINKCMSAINQSKMSLDLEQIKKINTIIFGCDVCQKVCPHNKDKDNYVIEELKAYNALIELKELFLMTNKEFDLKYGDKACSWRGKLVLQRNAACIIFNQDLKEYRYLLEDSLKKIDTYWYKETITTILENWK